MVDDVFDAMADDCRRELLVGLLDHDRQHVPPLSDRSLEVADADGVLLERYLNSARDIDGVDDDLLRLRLVDLPELAKGGFVEWNRESGVVARGPRFDVAVPFLEVYEDRYRDRSADGMVEISIGEPAAGEARPR